MRLSPTPAAGLIAAHSALTTGVHGITGTVCGTSETQTLTNKMIGAGGLEFDNEGAGGNPKLTCSSAGKMLSLDSDLISLADYWFRSATAFSGILSHTITTSRTWTFPDVAGNVLIDADTGKSPTFTSVIVLNVGAGANPIITSDSVIQMLTITGGMEVTGALYSGSDMLIKSGTAFNLTLGHNISANRSISFPDIAGTVCMWDAANAAVTRYYSGDANHIWGCGAVFAGTWTFPDANYVQCPNTAGTLIIPVNLPHGAIVTALRIASILTNVSDACAMRIYRKPRLAAGMEEMARCNATTTLEEISDTSIANATVDNDTYSYHIQIYKSGTNNTFKIYNYQIDYTVTQPYP